MNPLHPSSVLLPSDWNQEVYFLRTWWCMADISWQPCAVVGSKSLGVPLHSLHEVSWGRWGQDMSHPHLICIPCKYYKGVTYRVCLSLGTREVYVSWRPSGSPYPCPCVRGLHVFIVSWGLRHFRPGYESSPYLCPCIKSRGVARIFIRRRQR